MRHLFTFLFIALFAISVQAQCLVEFTPTQAGDELSIVGQSVNTIITQNETLNFDGNGIIEFSYSGANGASFSYNCGSIVYNSGLISDGFQHFESSPLPVELTSFTVKLLESSYAVLEFQTSSEENNSHFEVERSTDGKDFKVLGIVNGNGTRVETHDYYFVDDFTQRGTNYYRLKQVDYDGQFEYSKIISIDVETESNNTLISNVVTDEIRFNVSVEARLYDINGNLLKRATGQKIDVYDLPAGIYILRINNESFKVLKQ
jgi:hypothetical protein